jgi:valyl-tRNA synthetase
MRIAVALAGLVDVAAERQRLQKELDKQAEALARLERKLGNAGFLAAAAAEVVEKARADAASLEQAVKQLQLQLSGMQELSN